MAQDKAAVHAEAAVMLREAREHIGKVGWTQGSFRNAGRVCLLQALRDVDGKKHGAAVDAEAQRIVRNLCNTPSIPEFNDKTTTTREDVLLLLQAAEQCERELAGTA